MNLQESIRRILREERKEVFKEKLLSMIKNEGTKFAANLVGGMDNLFRFLDIHNPIQFLKIFKGLNIEIDGNDIFYKTDEGVIQFVLNEEDYGYIKLYVGSRILEGVSHFYRNESDRSSTIKLWFKNEYNIKGDIRRALYFLPSGDIIYAD
jgi:hypothetical protein